MRNGDSEGVKSRGKNNCKSEIQGSLHCPVRLRSGFGRDDGNFTAGKENPMSQKRDMGHPDCAAIVAI